MKRRHQRTLELIFARPASGNVQWRDIEALFGELGAEISEREGTQVKSGIKHLHRIEFWRSDEHLIHPSLPYGLRFMVHPRARVALEELGPH